MKIGIDARMLGPEQGGLGRYVEQLIYHLSLIDHDNEYVLFLTRSNIDKVVLASEQFQYTKVLADIPWYGWREQILFPKLIRKYQLTMMHFPHWNVPIFYCQPFVVTIHDLLLLRYPTRSASTLGLLTYWFKHLAYRLVLRHAVRTARHIFTTSEFTKNDVHTTLGVPQKKMTVTYQAPSSISNKKFFSAEHNDTKTKIEKIDIRKHYPGITKPYILYVGVAYPHKNLERLLMAWQIVQTKTNHAYQLVLAGKKNYFYNRINQIIQKQGITDVVLTDFVPDEDLHLFYENAKLYVFPSLYEGFGLPPLEAWTYNVPVVASQATCLPEILGEGVLYFDPKSVHQMADVITQGLEDNGIRSLLRENARLELPRYSWKTLAQNTLVMYKKAVVE